MKHPRSLCPWVALLRRDYSLTVLLRSSGEQVRTWPSFYFTPWSRVRAVHLDDDGILDLVGLRDGKLVTRISSQD